ncbi:MAG TPA: DUF2520 domain-containing protein [Pyrinomonadaceae bacterium]|nr:DUF2520 domain-containing protein [Pyrinomonadaceae bacterium]
MKQAAIIGVGRVGGAFALALDRCGFAVSEVVTRDGSTPNIADSLSQSPEVSAIGSSSSIRAEIVIIAVPDPSISLVMEAVRSRVAESAVIFHTSGSLASDVLISTGQAARNFGSLHPLIAISDPISGAIAFSGSYFCIEGGEEAVAIGRKLVASFGAHELIVETKKKPLYHAGAVMSAGHLIALHATAMRLFAHAGIDGSTGKEALLALSRSALRNLESSSAEVALTGTFARLDIETFRRHLESFDAYGDENSREVYLDLGVASLGLVAETPENSAARQKFEQELNMAKAKGK